MAFTLDTSGAVWIDPMAWRGSRALRWPDLSPFAQGYVEALLRSHPFTDRGREYAQFDRLHPETLAVILKDCASEQETYGFADKRYGEGFWIARQRGDLETFPPLFVYLDPNGKVRTKPASEGAA